MESSPKATMEDPCKILSFQMTLNKGKESMILPTQLEWRTNKLDPVEMEFILNYSPNLTTFTTKGFNNLECMIKVLNSVISKAEKPRKNPLIISHLSIRLDQMQDLEDAEKFSGHPKIKTENLMLEITTNFFKNFPSVETRISNMMTKVLSNNAKTLQKLTLHQCESYLSLLYFPPMIRLTHLELYFDGETPGDLSQCKFSPSFQFSDDIPNLENFGVYRQHRHKCTEFGQALFARINFLVSLFENAGPAPNVLRLEISDAVAFDLAIEPLFQVFPNIEELDVGIIDFSKRTFKSLWIYGKSLKKLHLTISARRVTQKVADVDLDSIFTGFTPWTVERMKKHRKLAARSGDRLNKMRVNPSVLNLKELKDLQIEFREEKPGQMPTKMLSFAQKFAFKFMRQGFRVLAYARGLKSTFYHHMYFIAFGLVPVSVAFV